ncbi:MAG: hypothetical protein M0R74_10195, partial [Dehalococcoidia bacterium]|nr:hypothetical protein [Dehalococcoidia bacterium]
MRIQGVDYNLRTMIQNRGVAWFQQHIMGTLMESVNSTPPILTPEDFSIRELFEAVDSRDFPVITGELLSRRMIASYNMAARVGDTLVERMPSNKKTERIPGFE